MPLKLEHQELHANLVKATKAGGRAGDAAKAVARVLHVHFVKEEEFALPSTLDPSLVETIIEQK